MEANKFTKELIQWLKKEGFRRSQPIIDKPDTISKRLYIAIQIAQGFAADSNIEGSFIDLIKASYIWTDELIKQEHLTKD